MLTINSPAMAAVPTLAPSFKAGTQIPVFGTLVGPYKNLAISWAEGVTPSSGWNSAGVTLSGSIASPVTNETLGSWDTSSVTTADYFTVRLSADLSGASYAASTVVYIDPTLLSSEWPKWLNAWSREFVGPVPALDNSGESHLAVTTGTYSYVSQDPPEIRSFSADGSSALSLPFPQDGSWAQPAAGNLDLDSGDDLVGTDGNSVRVFRPDGSSLALTPNSSFGFLLFPFRVPILADVDGDSLLEVGAMGTEGNSGGNAGTPAGLAYVFAWRSDGTLLNSNFPFTVPDRNLTLTEYAVPRVVVGDVNGDGSQEFVVIEGTSNNIITPRLFGSNGIQLNWGAQPISGFPCQLSLADLDHNGMLETIIFNCDGNLHILQPDGTERKGWPQRIPYSFGTVTVGDLGRDGNEEIVVSSGDLYAFNTDGTQFSNVWPKFGNYNPASEFFYAQAVLADINGDGYPEILTTLEKLVTGGPAGLPTYLTAQLIALDRFGNTVRSWNLPGAQGEAPGEFVYPTVSDFNGDGLTEIAVQYGLNAVGAELPSTIISAFSTGGQFKPDANDWPMSMHDSGNTSTFRVVSQSKITMISSSNPSAAGKTATFTLAVAATSQNSNTPTGKVNLLDGAQNIGSCVLSSGRCAITPTLAPGTHKLLARYIGDRNFGVSSSATFVQSVQTMPTAAVPTFNPTAGPYNMTQAVVVSDSTPGAVIYYTTNGTTPTTSSTKYSVPIKVAATATLEAFVVATGYSNSAVAKSNYTLVVATPSFSPAAGTFNAAQTVAISSVTPGATIYYTTNGTAPTINSTKYTGTIKVSAAETLEALATATGLSNSGVATANYTLATAPPTFSPASGTFNAPQTVTLSSATPGAIIYYTINSTAPTINSTKYTGPIKVSATETLEVMAVASGYSNSAVSAATFTLVAVAPTFSPAAGAFNSAQTVAISSATPSVATYYTTNGTTPTTNSTKCTGPIKVSATETLEAVAVASGFSNSAVSAATFTLVTAAPTFSPAAGAFNSAQTVAISSATPGATIYYTTNGTTPTTNSTKYTGPIQLSATQPLEAIAVATGYSTSTVNSAKYAIR
jgi:hypothetical protein